MKDLSSELKDTFTIDREAVFNKGKCILEYNLLETTAYAVQNFFASDSFV
jgi:hypothetical protein